jgi:hypothetical protein
MDIELPSIFTMHMAGRRWWIEAPSTGDPVRRDPVCIAYDFATFRGLPSAPTVRTLSEAVMVTFGTQLHGSPRKIAHHSSCSIVA